MYGIDYFEYKDLHIETVRKLLSIVSKDEDINSPGVWHPKGITAFQRQNGDTNYQPLHQE